MKFLIITGMSGAGKTRAADVLEDMDYYCVDNIPAALLPKLAEFCAGLGGRYEKVAIVTDLRDAGGVSAIFEALEQLKAQGCVYEILFMAADVPTLIRRYKESRRPHPLQAEAGSLEAAVALEAMRLERLRECADYLIDSSSLTLGQLQREIYRRLVEDEDGRTLRVCVMSFGFKYGIPAEADMVLDVRFLPNPYYVSELREKSGMDQEIWDFVFRHGASNKFVELADQLITFLLPQYVEEGKHMLTIAVGCTGGRHHSVAVARALAERINAQGHPAELVNRDMNRQEGAR
ncbi:MAG: RNase adapter RapZ [Oscillospiraceae bacterium]|nr:RNase adapter RapZ [Oscillospiraceae bacterium]